MAKALTKKDAATLRRLDRKVVNGKATRAEVMRAIDLKRRPGAANALSRATGDA